MSPTDNTPAVNRKLLILLGVVAAAALVAVFVVLPLLDGGSGETIELVQPPPAGAEVGEEPDAAPDDGEDTREDDDGDDAQVDETFEVFSARDPFKQLVVPVSAPADDPADGQNPVDPDDPDAGDPDDGEPDDGRGGPRQVEAYIVELVDVYRDGDVDKVQVLVNDTGYDVAVNERFADHFQLLSIEDECARFLYGDNRFVLCQGDAIRK